VRWLLLCDLDQTYIETDFQSLRGLVRAATEKARDKKTVPGAAVLLRALSHQPETALCFLSGSPEQLRAVLTKKLDLDGLCVEQLILKDGLDQIRRGRLKEIRNQVGYKLPAMFQLRLRYSGDFQEILFGDDTESDPLIYHLYWSAITGQLDASHLTRAMRKAGASEDSAEEAASLSLRLTDKGKIHRIFIRMTKGGPLSRFDGFPDVFCPVFGWVQVAMVLFGDGLLEEQAFLDVLEKADLEPFAVLGFLQDLWRRGRMTSEQQAGIYELLALPKPEMVPDLPLSQRADLPKLIERWLE
jgi:hypothetical protein